jgi:SH3 domain protein
MMAAILGALLATLAWTGTSAAQTLYVTDSFEINLRTGPGNEFRIIALLPSGTRVEALEQGEEWSRVRTEKGTEGWVVKRMISADLPARILVERLQRENERLKTTTGRTTEQAQGLTAENKELSSSLQASQKELNDLRQNYASLRADAENVIQLQERFKQTATELEKVAAEKERLATENRDLRGETRLRWFLAGGGVMGGSLLFGFVMGRLQRRDRRTSLYS